MKNSLYLIAVLLIVVWGILYWGLHTHGAVHLLLALAAIVIILRLSVNKQFSKQ